MIKNYKLIGYFIHGLPLYDDDEAPDGACDSGLQHLEAVLPAVPVEQAATQAEAQRRRPEDDRGGGGGDFKSFKRRWFKDLMEKI